MCLPRLILLRKVVLQFQHMNRFVILTSIAFFSMNFSTVDRQITSMCKGFATYCATEWLFASVHSHMQIKKEAPCKRFVTQSAAVWLFA
jgi:hypothetical protein